MARRKPVLAKWKIKGNEESIGRFAWAVSPSTLGYMEPRRGKADETGSVDESGMLQPSFEHRTSSKTEMEPSSPGEDRIGEDGYAPLAIKLP